ncbi:phosphoribosylamine--glycine ligase [Kamptonema cortianum]|nr:phosphoribosylamine--glycine ligase [Geitlerinema splendidum]MDK3156243.1 phosphoribosylamine--glycine ligase [Kamptonema cortianum]
MKIFVIGGGGREHALCWKLAQDGHTIAAAPGNPGIAQVAEVFPIPVNDRMGLLQAAQSFQPDFIIVGPEDPLIAGIADMFRANDFKVFGPDQSAARLEGSKSFSKDMMKRSGVPTAAFQSFSDPRQAKDFAAAKFANGSQVVVKASGAALGKGVIVCDEFPDAEKAIDDMLIELAFGEAGRTIVVEERLFGQEFSLFTLISGQSICSLPVAQDYKRVGDGDSGPNTGGMGSYCPASWVTPDLIQSCEETVVRPILSTLAELDITYQGVLFSGMILTESGPKCLEYNVRFGDPEIQSVVRTIGKGFAEALFAVASGDPIPDITTNGQSSVSVVMAAKNYPGSPETGAEIAIGELPSGVEIFAAGAKSSGSTWQVSGGRVLAVSAVGKSLAEARSLAYQGVDAVQFEGQQYRTDIAAQP